MFFSICVPVHSQSHDQPLLARCSQAAEPRRQVSDRAFGPVAWQAVWLPWWRCSVRSGSPVRSAVGAIRCHQLVLVLMKPVTSPRTTRFPLWWNILSWNMKSATDTEVSGHNLSASPFLLSQHKAAIWEGRCAVASGLRRSKYVMCSVLQKIPAVMSVTDCQSMGNREALPQETLIVVSQFPVGCCHFAVSTPSFRVKAKS